MSDLLKGFGGGISRFQVLGMRASFSSPKLPKFRAPKTQYQDRVLGQGIAAI